MKTELAPKFTLGPVRDALGELWWLNVKVFPSAALWSLSTFFLLELDGIYLKVLCVLSGFTFAVISSSVVSTGNAKMMKRDLGSLFLSSHFWKVIFFSGSILIASLHNVSHFQGSNSTIRIFMVANAFSALFLAAFAVAVYIPCRIVADRSGNSSDFWRLFMSFLSFHKRTVLISILVLLCSWPIIFFYIFLALPFSQLLTKSAFSTYLSKLSPSRVSIVNG